MQKPTSEARTLALACGAGQRAYVELMAMLKHTTQLPRRIAVQGGIVIEEMDLLRHYLREATLRGVIEPAAPSMPAKLQAPRSALQAPASGKAKGGHARAAKLAPAKRKAIARKAAKARWGKR